MKRYHLGGAISFIMASAVSFRSNPKWLVTSTQVLVRVVTLPKFKRYKADNDFLYSSKTLELG